MPPLPVIDAKTFIKFLESLGFYFVRQKGSHVRYKHDDGRAVTVPIHGKEALENRVSYSIFTFYSCMATRLAYFYLHLLIKSSRQFLQKINPDIDAAVFYSAHYRLRRP
mgnify:CR=1 FL=1